VLALTPSIAETGVSLNRYGKEKHLEERHFLQLTRLAWPFGPISDSRVGYYSAKIVEEVEQPMNMAGAFSCFSVICVAR